MGASYHELRLRAIKFQIMISQLHPSRSIEMLFLRCPAYLALSCLALLVAGCASLPPAASPTPTVAATENAQHDTAASLATPFPNGLVDALPVMLGICFESAFDAANQVFVLRSTAELQQFYDLADNSRLCRQPVERYEYEFAEGDVLAGFWSVGRGCRADHEILAVQRDDDERTLSIQTRFITEGLCNYELVRPFWVLIRDAADYEVVVSVEP